MIAIAGGTATAKDENPHLKVKAHPRSKNVRTDRNEAHVVGRIKVNRAISGCLLSIRFHRDEIVDNYANIVLTHERDNFFIQKHTKIK